MKKIQQIENKFIIEYYKKFIGEKELDLLINKFNNKDFCNKWEQVMTSRSTGLFGTGITYSSVQATYALNQNGNINLLNEAYDTDFNYVSVKGESEARDNKIPTCRTVKFDKISSKGNYWIIYISSSFNSIIIGAPLIIPFIPIKISNNFGVYVLAKNTNDFWNSKEETNEIFDALKKYGFEKFWNKPISSSKTFLIK
jgi:hypothetical protein